MPAIKIQGFDGFVPRKSAYLLADNEAELAQNVKLFSGELRSWQSPVKVTPEPIIKDGAQAVYRLERPSDLASQWLSWVDDVDVVPSPIADTTDGRIYYTGEATPRKTNFALATGGPAPFPFDYLEMGVPAPTLTPTLTETVSGNGTRQNRVYVFTYVSQFGSVQEESAPSPTATILVHPTGTTVTVGNLGAMPPTGKYNITHKRIYRTVGGNTGVDYRFVGEVPIGQTTFTDNLDDIAIVNRPRLRSLNFTPPPEDLRGIVAMPGGFLAGFRRNEVWFSEPNFPHAWPAEYVLTVRHNVVGLGVVNNLLVVGTERFPEIIYGNAPSALGQEIIPLNEPAASKRSFTTDGEAVVYASPNGLVAIGPGVRQRITDNLFRRDEFQEYTPTSLYGRVYDGTYFGWFDSQQQGQGALLINGTDRPALSRLGAFTRAAFIDTRDAELYYVDPVDGLLYQFDADPVNNVEYFWSSKKFDFPFPTNMGVVQVYADYAFINELDVAQDVIDQILADNAINIAAKRTQIPVSQSSIGAFPVSGGNIRSVQSSFVPRFVAVDVFGDEQLVSSQGFLDERPIKLPSGRRYRTFQIAVRGNIPVFTVAIGSTAADLKDV